MDLVDYEKAFDSVVIPNVIDALKEQGVEPVYVNVLQHIYKYAKSYIRLHKDSKWFRRRRGIRQGDTSSRKMFIAFLEKVFRKLPWEKKGIKIGSEYLTHPRFADDIIIFANSMEEFQEMLHELNQASLEVGLSMNLKKTKVMYNEFAEDVEEPTTIDSRSLHLPRSMHLHGFRFEGTWDQTSYHARMASFR